MTAKLPSYLPSTMTEQLDASYTRGFITGRAAGLERACEILRNMQYSADRVQILEILTREKYQPS